MQVYYVPMYVKDPFLAKIFLQPTILYHFTRLQPFLNQQWFILMPWLYIILSDLQVRHPNKQNLTSFITTHCTRCQNSSYIEAVHTSSEFPQLALAAIRKVEWQVHLFLRNLLYKVSCHLVPLCASNYGDGITAPQSNSSISMSPSFRLVPAIFLDCKVLSIWAAFA